MPADEHDAPRAAQPAPQQSLPRRVARRAAGPVLDPIHRRFDAIETRLDDCTRLLLEVRDRVEADLSSMVELTIELQRALDELRPDRERPPDDAAR